MAIPCGVTIARLAGTGRRTSEWYHGEAFAPNQLWCEIAALACELLAWTQMLALAGTARRREPKRLRLRLFSVAGRLASSGRRLRLRLAAYWPWAAGITAAVTRLQALPSAGV